MQLNFLIFFLFFSCSSASSFIKICFALIHTTLASYGVNGKVVRLNQTLIPHFGKLPKVCCFFFSRVGWMCLQSSHFFVCACVFIWNANVFLHPFFRAQFAEISGMRFSSRALDGISQTFVSLCVASRALIQFTLSPLLLTDVWKYLSRRLFCLSSLRRVRRQPFLPCHFFDFVVVVSGMLFFYFTMAATFVLD